MTERLTSSTNSNCTGCELSIYCDVNKELFFSGNPISKPISSAEIEASQIIGQVDRGIKNADLEELFQDWKDRMALRFVGDPEGLARAFESIDALNEDIYVSQLENDISSRERMHSAIDDEVQQSEKSQAIDAALEVRDACEGPHIVKVGGFLSKRTVQVCGMEDKPEFSKIREYKNNDEQYIADNSSQLDI